MVDPSLVSFIQANLQQGYDINTIQNHLLGQGYQLKDIQAAVGVIYGAPHVHHTIELSKATIISILAASLILIIAVFFAFSFFDKGAAPPALLDLSLSSDMESVKPGDNFVFRYSATQTGNKKRFDFRIKHEVLDYNNQLITSAEEEVAIETKVSDTRQLKIPSDTLPGKYVLKSTASYDGKKASARINFKVGEAKKEGLEEKPAEPKEPIPPAVAEKKTAQPPVQREEELPSLPKPAMPSQNAHAITEEAIKASTADVSKAGKLCDSLLELRDRDKCFEKISENAQSSRLCANIQSNSKRDTCYMNFAIEGDYSVCAKVENQYLKKSCESLASLNS